MTPPARNAQLRLRGGTLGAQLAWPPGAAAGMLTLLVEVGEAALGERIAQALADEHGVVVLSAECRGMDDGANAIGWAADHAADLGAGGRLLLAGLHAAAGIAAELAARAREEGWPDLTLIDPGPGARV